ncbi:MAG: hypothetical protein IPM82_11815 [Saprospiraceae bacterium]|nr:hypothetical protein [Saprospiraceae bacterium]
MHRPFKYIPSPIQQLHEHVAEIVGIWCDAAGAFSVDLIQDAVLKDLVGKIEVRKQKWQQVIADIHELFRQLTPAERKAIREGFIQNNRIEELCSKTADPVHYSDLPELVRQPLKDFFTELYTGVLNRKPFIDAYKTTTKDYFDKLIETSDLTICPFCGMNSLKSKYQDGRDAFDHFLPKGTYPFNAINFKNLAPICHECNSDEKLAKDPLFEGAEKTGRRLATFPVSNEVAAVTVSVQFELI